ncbi:TetR/AcrR family transcriptional regulator [Sphaerisporangium sp. TRM90804]|uniref:TetR/AcrR family transcriptional regulator n=1 Tax=Sphaerisporangium sp. TRM90804 TaxID=3031113 RepID=UPI00244D493B|nr:TetR/AcrR family transcriptional regulator [Sphaerisporangium sp. TRM90804]MDH2427445.1 TetR/AcrR family transcriptional regulator [Sphaerisporangium sp. TRM90804]
MRREELVADAAITLLVERGMRGLTHRAVDEAAGLPLGSTSNLARTRAALLALTLARLTALEEGYFAAVPGAGTVPDAGAVPGPGAVPGAEVIPGPDTVVPGAGAVPGPGAVPGVDAVPVPDVTVPRPDTVPAQEVDLGPERLTDLVVQLLHGQLTTGRRTTIARYELALEATRRPELRTIYAQAGRRFREVATAMLAAAGSPDPARHGRQLVAYGEGVIFDAIAGAGAVPTLQELTAGTTELLRGMLSCAHPAP